MTHSELHTYPAAITSPELGQYDEALLEAVKWARGQDSGRKLLLSVADRNHVQSSDLLQSLGKMPWIVVDTRNRGPHRSWQGPVVGVAVNRNDLDRLPLREATAVCLTPWGVNYEAPRSIDASMTGLRPWVTGTVAVGVAGAIRWSDDVEIGATLGVNDAEYMRAHTGMINFANPLSASREKRDLVGALKGLLSRTGHIDVDAAEAWAWSQGWDGGQVAVLRDYSEKINAGKTIRVSR